MTNNTIQHPCDLDELRDRLRDQAIHLDKLKLSFADWRMFDLPEMRIPQDTLPGLIALGFILIPTIIIWAAIIICTAPAH